VEKCVAIAGADIEYDNEYGMVYFIQIHANMFNTEYKYTCTYKIQWQYPILIATIGAFKEYEYGGLEIVFNNND